MYYVYVIRNEKGRTYTGDSSNLKARLKSHNDGENRSTKNHRWEIIYYEAYRSEDDARRREKQLKVSGQARRWLKERIRQSLLSSQG